MFTILLHSSKTMRFATSIPTQATTTPLFIKQAQQLATYVAGLDTTTIAQAMKVSPILAAKTHAQMNKWRPHDGGPAIDSFVGDIYSGLQAATFTLEDRAYAQKCLVLLSGLYGVLRPLDSIMPYRVEMGYHFPDKPFNNLYTFWGDKIASSLPASQTIINTSSAEYTKALLPYLTGQSVITPAFYTISPHTKQPAFVTVHTKVARGAFARWMITNRIEDESQLKDFRELGYRYDEALSSSLQPAFVAMTFQGLGLSVRKEDMIK